jgi:hypothetical protein
MIVVVILAAVAVLNQSFGKVPQKLRILGCPALVYSPHGAFFKASCFSRKYKTSAKVVALEVFC